MNSQVLKPSLLKSVKRILTLAKLCLKFVPNLARFGTHRLTWQR